MRSDFNPLALFAASLPTDQHGRASVSFRLPGNLTRYRVMAVAVAGARQFGRAETTITARLPLMVRPSPPRFLNFGDRCELPVLLQNQSDVPLQVEVALRATNLQLTGAAGQRVWVPANDRVEVRFPVAAERPGTARVQVGASGGRWADAAEVALPVWTPVTSESAATYGQLDAGMAVQPIQPPAGVLPQVGGMELTTASTLLQELTDAVLYLTNYPFLCSEQLASRVLAVAALREVLSAFAAKELPQPSELIAAVERDLQHLRALQNYDGGFSFWRRSETSWPFISVHAAHALQRAAEKGFVVSDFALASASRYLQTIEGDFPAEYPLQVRQAVSAYALYVRRRLGQGDPPRARALLRKTGVERLSLEALGWLLAALTGEDGVEPELEAIRRRLWNQVSETAATAQFTDAYNDGGHLLLHSSRRADAVILEALIADQPQSELIPKLARGLLAQRRSGRWQTTQENVFVLLALERYFAAYEQEPPDFLAQVWLGRQAVGAQHFRGHTIERRHLLVPMALLQSAREAGRLVLRHQGRGRLYYRVGLRYAREDLQQEAVDRGFSVERAYEAVDNPQDVRRDEEGVWMVRAGARVRVTLTLVVPARRYHVALVDRLPAGLEPLNPELTVVDRLTEVQEAFPWQRPWYEHQNLRDERVEVFSALLREGGYRYSYLARATTPGHFVVPPPKVEEMYAPEVFGRGAGDRLLVQATG